MKSRFQFAICDGPSARVVPGVGEYGVGYTQGLCECRVPFSMIDSQQNRQVLCQAHKHQVNMVSVCLTMPLCVVGNQARKVESFRF